MKQGLPQIVKETILQYKKEYETYVYQNRILIEGEGYYYVIYNSAGLPSGYLLVKEDGSAPSYEEARDLLTFANSTISAFQFVIGYGTERVFNQFFMVYLCKIFELTLKLAKPRSLQPEMHEWYDQFLSVPTIFVRNRKIVKEVIEKAKEVEKLSNHRTIVNQEIDQKINQCREEFLKLSIEQEAIQIETEEDRKNFLRYYLSFKQIWKIHRWLIFLILYVCHRLFTSNKKNREYYQKLKEDPLLEKRTEEDVRRVFSMLRNR